MSVAGNSKLWEADDGSDSVFYIWVGVEITDHPLTTHGAYHNIDMSVFVADEIVTGEEGAAIMIKSDISLSVLQPVNLLVWSELQTVKTGP